MTMKSLLWIVAVLSLLTAWWCDHRRLAKQIKEDNIQWVQVAGVSSSTGSWNDSPAHPIASKDDILASIAIRIDCRYKSQPIDVVLRMTEGNEHLAEDVIRAFDDVWESGAGPKEMFELEAKIRRAGGPRWIRGGH